MNNRIGAVCIGNGQADIATHITVEVAQTLSTMHDQLIVVIFDDMRVVNSSGNDIAGTLDSNYWKGQGERAGVEREYIVKMTYQRVTGTLSQGGHPGSYNGQDAYNDMLVVNDYLKGECELASVRRLTVLECTRLQGFPDGWVDIGEWTDSEGKLHKETDSPKYKALGNSIALPFWFYLLRRISAQYERPATLGSLFDGIGGFPLCWEKCNGKGTAIWASEIEEFPIAVTKKHFPEER